jgi:23S rRNA pseudouridine1911/1915/1917 synthase
MNRPLSTLWEDAHGLAVAKPAGMLTQGGTVEDPSLDDLVRRHLRPDDPNSAYLGTIHRLDRPVSGVVLFAKNPKAARRWSAQFARREARKVYWAIVEGNLDALAPRGQWDDLLAPPDREGRAQVVTEDNPAGRPASTGYEVDRKSAPIEGCGRLILDPRTGRTHQLRVQLASRGWPVLGDATYGATRPFPRGIALHARRLEVVHPASGRTIAFEAPLPEAWPV